MNKSAGLLLWFLALMFAQAFVLDPIVLGSTYVPFVYILLLIIIPNNWKPWVVLLAGFFIGWCVDLIFLTGGIHTAACLIVSYAQPILIRAVYRDTITPKELKLEHESFGSLFRYTILFILVHHFFVFAFIVASANRIGWLLDAWLINSIITIFVSGLILLLTRKNNP